MVNTINRTPAPEVAAHLEEEAPDKTGGSVEFPISVEVNFTQLCVANPLTLPPADNPARAHFPPFFTPERAAAVRGTAVAQPHF